MKKMFGGLTVLLIIGMVLAGCANPLGQGDGSARGAAYVPTAADKSVAVELPARVLNTKRTNASGDKITSNARSADFPGIYFYWDDKQKEDGLLMVESQYFTDEYTEFTVTIKLANEYWDWTVSLQPNQETTPDGYYTFIMPRDGLPKNINMVFLNDWVALRHSRFDETVSPVPVIEDGVISFAKVVKDVRGGFAPGLSAEETAQITFDIYDNAELVGVPVKSGLTLVDGRVYYKGPEIIVGKTYYIKENLNGLEGKYYPLSQGMAIATTDKLNITLSSFNSSPEASEVDPDNTWMLGDQHIKQLWTDTLQNSADAALYNAMMDIKTDGGNAPTWIWTRPDSWKTGVSGDDVMISVSTFEIPEGFTVPDDTWFYFACDNAAVVYVNDTWVACTTEAFGHNVGVGTTAYSFKTLDSSAFDGSPNGWAHVYKVNIKKYLKEGAGNTIKIYAANSAQADGPNAGYDTSNNPAGLIYACSINAVGSDNAQFTNELKEYYSFWAGIHLDFSSSPENSNAKGTATPTMIGGPEYVLPGKGWTGTYIYVEGLSKHDSKDFQLRQNGNYFGNLNLSVNDNGELVITLDGIVLNSGTEVIKVLISTSQADINKSNDQGSYPFKAKAPALVDGKYIITIPASTFNLYKNFKDA